MYYLTVFHNKFDNQTDKVISVKTWNEMVDLFRSMHNTEYDRKESAPLISSAVYREGSTRANKNVVEWSPWCALDVDDINCNGDEIYDFINSRFSNWDYICHSSGSSTFDRPKCRVILRLGRSIVQDEITQFWYALNKRFGGLGDEQTKDLSRMFYVPGKVAGSYQFMFVNNGDAINPDSLIEQYPYVKPTGNNFLDKLPEEIKQKVIEHRVHSLTNTNITWTSYRDCPFLPKKLVERYKCISGSGWYLMMYKIMIAVACNAVSKKYPITPEQIATICRELDRETGNWYDNRPLEREAAGAIQWAYANSYAFE
jgi:hypothetical protein